MKNNLGRWIAAGVLAVLPLFSQSAQFPSSVADNGDLLVARNNAQSTLGGGINDSVTTFTVNAASSFISDMVVVIGSEQIFCTTFSSTTFSTCTRGFDSTTPAAHSKGDNVSGYLVAWHHNSLKEELKAIEQSLIGTSYIGTFVRLGGVTSSFPALKRSTTELQVRLADDSAYAPFAAGDVTLQGSDTETDLGGELVTDGIFASDLSNWTIEDAGADWVWDTGTAAHDLATIKKLYQSVTVVTGSYYILEYTISGRSLGTVTPSLGAVNGFAQSSNATQTQTFKATATGAVDLALLPTTDFDGALDNVTLQVISSTTTPVLALKNDDGAAGVEIRAGGSALLNIFLGVYSGVQNTTGTQNTGVGEGALYRNTTGNYNTAIGRRALHENTTGIQNTAAGVLALSANTTGSYNTAVGRYALFSNTVGTHNSAVGQSALFANTTGTDNTAVGQGALTANTTGIGNTGVAAYALFSSTEATDNTAIGQSALYYNTTGSYNTAIGRRALHENTIGEHNTGIGYRVLYENTEGIGNIGFGYQAGDNLTTGDYNIIIGYDLDASSATGDYQLNIGGALTGALDTGIFAAAVWNATTGFRVGGAATSGQFLRGNGTNFVDAAIAAADLPTAIDAAKLADGSVSNVEFQRLDGLSADIQGQIDGKQPIQKVYFQPGDAIFPAANSAYLQCKESSAGAPRPKWCEVLYTTTDIAIWHFVALDNLTGTITVGVLYKMSTSVGSKNIEMSSQVACLTPGDATDMDADSYAGADASADDPAPATAGYLAEHTWTMATPDGMVAGDSCVISLTRTAPSADDHTGELEFVQGYISW